MKLLKHCYDAIEALDFLRINSVDLIFLDLNMPKLRGFDFLRALQNRPQVIITTAYKEHALEGFELDVIDYLLKPFSFERFLRAINKTTKLQSNSRLIELSTITEEQHIFLYSDKKHVQVKLKDILFIEAAGNYCKVVLDEDKILIREKISNILETIPSDRFIQVHKSYAVAKANIKAVEGNRILIKDYQIPIGKHYKGNVVEFLKL